MSGHMATCKNHIDGKNLVIPVDETDLGDRTLRCVGDERNASFELLCIPIWPHLTSGCIV